LSGSSSPHEPPSEERRATVDIERRQRILTHQCDLQGLHAAGLALSPRHAVDDLVDVRNELLARYGFEIEHLKPPHDMCAVCFSPQTEQSAFLSRSWNI
jgi:hypothetical protein